MQKNVPLVLCMMLVWLKILSAWYTTLAYTTLPFLFFVAQHC